MPEESTTPDLIELTRQGIDAGITSLYAADVVSEQRNYIAGMDIDGVRAAAERLAEERG